MTWIWTAGQRLAKCSSGLGVLLCVGLPRRQHAQRHKRYKGLIQEINQADNRIEERSLMRYADPSPKSIVRTHLRMIQSSLTILAREPDNQAAVRNMELIFHSTRDL